ncbi:N-acetylmuramoyl-L-alanine amidase [Gracilimonas sediminicola]|uniref:N-acetylmuramoyl-L-alanine amidase n=1 Tax=Gracilimonas sediminicola TaxID=2952158 RepID=UPI0038D358F0
MEFTELHNPNFEDRSRPVNGIIIHSMSEYINGMFANDFLADIGLSAHFLVGVDGAMYKCVDPDKKAYHAGLSEWGGQKYLNSSYVGIEILVEGDNDWSDFKKKIEDPATFKAEQYSSCIKLITWLKTEFPEITNENIVRHSEVSGPAVRPNDPKPDPGVGFNMIRVREAIKTPT